VVAEDYAKDGLPYAIWLSATIGRQGTVAVDPDGGGFTCATFVLAIFAGAGLDLIDESTWPHRDGDRDAYTQIVELLKDAPKITAEHLAAQVAYIESAKRYRPTEVAAAASLAATSPNPFAALEPIAAEIQSEYEAITAT